MPQIFKPQTISVLKEGYTWHLFTSDLIAGVITGIVAIPLSLAFGIASGATPQAGLYTAIIAGFLISLLSGSRVQIGGPTGAFIVIVYGIINSPSGYGFQGLLVATLMAGGILIAMGMFRFGAIIKYIPYPVTLGFTSGIAVIIATTQLRDFFGLVFEPNEKVPAEFLEKIAAFWEKRGTANIWAVVISSLTIGIVMLTPKFSKRIPGSLVAIVICTLIVWLFEIPVATIGKQFSNIDMQIPRPSMPSVTLKMVQDLIPSAVAIAMLGAIESLLSAVVADGMIGGRHRSNTELIGQGIANLASPLFGGLPATGAIARTATNIKNGGRTPFAGIIHAVVLLVAVLCLGKLVAVIPMAVLGGMLIVVAINMSEYRLFIRMFKAPRSDIVVMLLTFLLTVLIDLTYAIPLGMIMASFLFMRRMEQTFGAGEVRSLHRLSATDPEEDHDALHIYEVPDGVQVYEINGPFFFGAASKFQSLIQDQMPMVLILRMRNVPVMDATGMSAFEDLIKRAHKKKSTVLIAGIQPQVQRVLEKFGLLHDIGKFNIFQTLVEALPFAADLVQAELQARRESRSEGGSVSQLFGRSHSRIVKKKATPSRDVPLQSSAVPIQLGPISQSQLTTVLASDVTMVGEMSPNAEMKLSEQNATDAHATSLDHGSDERDRQVETVMIPVRVDVAHVSALAPPHSIVVDEQTSEVFEIPIDVPKELSIPNESAVVETYDGVTITQMSEFEQNADVTESFDLPNGLMSSMTESVASASESSDADTMTVKQIFESVTSEMTISKTELTTEGSDNQTIREISGAERPAILIDDDDVFETDPVVEEIKQAVLEEAIKPKSTDTTL